MNAFKLQEAIKEGVDIHRTRYGCKLISKAILNNITEINDKVTSLRSTRNKFSHFCWSRNTDDEIFGTNFSGGISDSKKHKKSCISFTLSELSSVYSEAYEIVDQLSSLVESLPRVEEDDIIKKL